MSSTQPFQRYPWEGIKFLIITLFVVFIGLFIAQFILKISLVTPLLLLTTILVCITLILWYIFKILPFNLGETSKSVRTNYLIIFILTFFAVIAMLIFYKDLSNILNVQLAVQKIQSMVGLM